MPKPAIGVEETALAGLSLAKAILAALVDGGLLTQGAADAVFQAAINGQRQSPAAPNQGAAYLLDEIRTGRIAWPLRL